MADTFIYRDYRIEIAKVGKGWRSLIFAPETERPLPDSPVSLVVCTKDAMVAKAKAVVDLQLQSK